MQRFMNTLAGFSLILLSAVALAQAPNGFGDRGDHRGDGGGGPQWGGGHPGGGGPGWGGGRPGDCDPRRPDCHRPGGPGPGPGPGWGGPHYPPPPPPPPPYYPPQYPPAYPPVYPPTYPAPVQLIRIECGSNDYRYAECFVGGRILSATMRIQESAAACVANSTWGATPDRIWVNSGCRGQFDVQVQY